MTQEEFDETQEQQDMELDAESEELDVTEEEETPAEPAEKPVKEQKAKDPFIVKQDAIASIPIINTSVEAARQALPTIKGAREVEEEVEEEVKEEKSEDDIPEEAKNAHIYALRTTANREDQVMAFVASNAGRKKLGVYSVIAPHGMRGYIFMEAADRHEAEQAIFGVPYAKGLLPNEIQYKEIEHMLEQVKKEINIQKNDIAEILSGPFKREKCKVSRVDKAKDEVVVELLEAAVPIPITLKIDAVKVIRRDEK